MLVANLQTIRAGGRTRTGTGLLPTDFLRLITATVAGLVMQASAPRSQFLSVSLLRHLLCSQGQTDDHENRRKLGLPPSQLQRGAVLLTPEIQLRRAMSEFAR